jgi:hypothetical protein
MAKAKRPGPWFRDPLTWLCFAPLTFVLLYSVGSIIGFDNLKAVKGEVWAAWVQAIGSIAAIWGAIWISSRQARSAMLQSRQQTSQRLDAIARLVQAASDSAMTAFNDQHPHPKNEFRAFEGDAYAGFGEAAEAIRSIALDALPSDVAVLEVFAARHALKDIEPLLNEMLRAKQLSAAGWDAFLRVRDRLDLAAVNLRSHAEMVLDGRGSMHLAAVNRERRNNNAGA